MWLVPIQSQNILPSNFQQSSTSSWSAKTRRKLLW